MKTTNTKTAKIRLTAIDSKPAIDIAALSKTVHDEMVEELKAKNAGLACDLRWNKPTECPDIDFGVEMIFHMAKKYGFRVDNMDEDSAHEATMFDISAGGKTGTIVIRGDEVCRVYNSALKGITDVTVNMGGFGITHVKFETPLDGEEANILQNAMEDVARAWSDLTTPPEFIVVEKHVYAMHHESKRVKIIDPLHSVYNK